MTCGIYQITAPSGNFYIGSSVNIEQRYRSHLSDAKNGRHHNEPLVRALEKYGCLKLSILLVCREQDLLFYEQRCIDGLRPEYNSSRIAGKVEMTPEVREKLSAAQKGKLASPETKAKMTEAHRGNQCRKGIPHSEEIRNQISRSLSGRPAHNKGTKHTEESLEKIRRAVRQNYAHGNLREKRIEQAKTMQRGSNGRWS